MTHALPLRGRLGRDPAVLRVRRAAAAAAALAAAVVLIPDQGRATSYSGTGVSCATASVESATACLGVFEGDHIVGGVQDFFDVSGWLQHGLTLSGLPSGAGTFGFGSLSVPVPDGEELAYMLVLEATINVVDNSAGVAAENQILSQYQSRLIDIPDLLYDSNLLLSGLEQQKTLLLDEIQALEEGRPRPGPLDAAYSKLDRLNEQIIAAENEISGLQGERFFLNSEIPRITANIETLEAEQLAGGQVKNFAAYHLDPLAACLASNTCTWGAADLGGAALSKGSGYFALVESSSVGAIPLPAGALLIVGAFGMMGAARRVTRRPAA